MRELSCSELPRIAGGTGFDNDVISAFGIVSALAGYEFSTNVMQTLGLGDGITRIGTYGAAFVGGTLALSLWTNPNYFPRDCVYIGLTVNFLCGASVGVAQGLINTTPPPERQ